MTGRSLIITAVAVYAVIVGLVLLPGSRAPGETAPIANSNEASGAVLPVLANSAKLTPLPFRGVAMQIQRVDWMDKYKKSMDEIAALGADTVSLVIDTRQETVHSNRIYLDMRMTPTPDQLKDLIKHAKSLGLRVFLMPIVLLDHPMADTDWRGTISPNGDAYGGWKEWWVSYREMLLQFAYIAEDSGVDVMSVGSELVSSESQADEWKSTIKIVRTAFHGRLTYSANWDHYSSIPFWKDLDLIGMNSYYKLGDDHNVKVDEIVKRWKDIQKDLLAFQRKIGKPLMFLEIGWCSLANAADEPWDYTKVDEPVDLDLQKRLYEGYFKSWYGNPALGGFIVWEWPPGEGGEEDRGYTPKDKPAEQVLREWLAKPKWTVK